MTFNEIGAGRADEIFNFRHASNFDRRIRPARLAAGMGSIGDGIDGRCTWIT